MVLPDIILLIVGRNENRNGSPTINFQCLDFIIGSIGFGKNLNHGKASNMNKLLVRERMLRQPSNNKEFGVVV